MSPRSWPCDPVELTAGLVRCPSVTPEEGGALQLLAGLLAPAGFDCVRVNRGGRANLFARWGPRGHARSFGFNGHTDVVPPGPPEAWSADPFAARISDGWLIGRGSVDMKSGVAAFVAAALDLVATAPPDGAIVLAITGDEEGLAQDGTAALLDWMGAAGEAMSVCLVGEPTCPDRLGDAIKIGRRGSLTVDLEAVGRQGHSAYPHRARNPVPALAELVHRLAATPLDTGTAHFDPSTLAVTTFDTGNPAANVIPRACRARVNIRFNDAHDATSLFAWIEREAGEIAVATGIDIATAPGKASPCFFNPPGALSDLVARAVLAETGIEPALTTNGGTSDARFVKDHCPVVEFGLVGRGMHEIDEAVETDQITALAAIYRRILADYFA